MQRTLLPTGALLWSPRKPKAANSGVTRVQGIMCTWCWHECEFSFNRLYSSSWPWWPECTCTTRLMLWFTVIWCHSSCQWILRVRGRQTFVTAKQTVNELYDLFMIDCVCLTSLCETMKVEKNLYPMSKLIHYICRSGWRRKLKC